MEKKTRTFELNTIRRLWLLESSPKNVSGSYPPKKELEKRDDSNAVCDKSKKQTIRCIMNTVRDFDDIIAQETLLSGRLPIKRYGNYLAIHPGYVVKIRYDRTGGEPILCIGRVHRKISALATAGTKLYDRAGIPAEIREVLESAGCVYKYVGKKELLWYSIEAIDERKAIYVDLIRFCGGFNNVFLEANLRGQLAVLMVLEEVAGTSFRNYLDRVCDAYLYGHNTHTSFLCNCVEGFATKAMWEATNEIIAPHGFEITHRVYSRLYTQKKAVGPFRSLARTPGDVLFNEMNILCEEEIWRILKEKGIALCDVGGFSHFSRNTSLEWMGLIVDLYDAPKFAGHVALTEAIAQGEINSDSTKAERGLYAEPVYALTKSGMDTLLKLKSNSFKQASLYWDFKGNRELLPFRTACEKFVVAFDGLLTEVCEEFEDRHLTWHPPESNKPVKYSYLDAALDWPILSEKERQTVRHFARKLCRKVITARGFQPIVWLPSRFIDGRISRELLALEHLKPYFSDWEFRQLKGKALVEEKQSRRVFIRGKEKRGER